MPLRQPYSVLGGNIGGWYFASLVDKVSTKVRLSAPHKHLLMTSAVAMAPGLESG